MSKKNTIYFFLCIFTSIIAGFVWYQYLTVDELGIESEFRIELESKFLLSVEPIFDVYQFEINNRQFDNLGVGSKTELEIQVDSVAIDNVEGLEFVLSYDPTVMKVTGIRNGNMFKYYLQREVNKEEGLVSISGAIQAEEYLNLQKYELATLVVERLAIGDPKLRTLGEEDLQNTPFISRVIELGSKGSSSIASQEF